MQDYIKITQAALRNSPFTQATHKVQYSAFRSGQVVNIQLDLPKGNDGQVEQLNSFKKGRNAYERGEPDKM